MRFYGKNKNAPTICLDDTKKTDQAVSGARKLLEEARLSRARIVNLLGDSILQSYSFKNPFDWYAFPSAVMDVVENTRHWYRNRAWYSSRHIPWRRGWLIFGPTGTGKTMLAKCMAQDLNMPVFQFDIGSMDNVEFEQYWREAQFYSPAMVLIEDFDAVFHGRQNIVETSTQKLTFDCLLNCVSGIESSDGLLLVITTNHEEHIDPALGVLDGTMSTRPGRIDDVVYLGKMDEGCRRAMAGRILGVVGVALEQVVSNTEGMTSAQFTDYCNKKALQYVSFAPKSSEVVVGA